jgi:hypothetical protein
MAQSVYRIDAGWAVHESNVGGVRFPAPSRPTARPTQLPVQWVPGFPGLKRPGRGADQQLRFISGLRALVVLEQACHWVTFTFNTSNNRALKA